jgi:flagellar biosynthetic protein FlhB
MAEDDDTSKEFDPTPRKLEDARRKGDIPRSADLTTAAAQAGFLLCLLAVGGATVGQIGTVFQGVLGDVARQSDALLGGERPLAGLFLAGLLPPLIPWFALPALAAVAALVVQQGFAISADKLQPKFSRISPLANAKNKFGLNGLFEFAKSTVKLCVIALCLGLFLIDRLPELIRSAEIDGAAGLALMIDMLVDFLFLAVGIAVAIGIIDLLWQRYSHSQKLRMSRKEVTDEHKQNEGDPQLKQQRRQRGYDIATNRMLQDVPKADVVIVNPSHYAVALKWERLPGRAPVCVARGRDEIAARIREAAAAAGVPVHRDPPTARALYATVRLGAQISPDHYRTVAAAIRFADRIRAHARARR